MDDADDEALAKINAIVKELTEEADKQLDADGIPAEARTYSKIMECRYLGQGFELRAEMPDGPLTHENKHAVVDSFFDVHKESYGHAFRDQITEGVTLRVVASAQVDQLRLPNLDHGGRENPHAALLYTNETVFDDGHATPTPRYDREKLLAEDRISGPSIITQHNSTTIVPPGYTATVLGHGDIRIERA